ncbi:MAG TPA: RIP metalloprotease RseP [Armatimonadota bacterium]|nr:RIP metalloprotease RseP [Armatimonadota bacterium]
MNSRSELVKNLLTAAVLVILAVVFWEQAKILISFLVTLGVLVAVHEWGHFIAARAVGVHAYEFAIGFGPKLLTYMRRNGTDYTIRALPLGGFVNLKGMQPDDPITHDGLNGRRPAERALVYLAGPLMNIILALAVFCFTGWLVGTPDESRPIAGEVMKNSATAEMGLQLGDRLLAVNGKPITDESTIFLEVGSSAGKPVELRVQRGQRQLTLTGTPRPQQVKGDYPTVVSAPAGGIALQAGDQIATVDGKYLGLFAPKKALSEVTRALQEHRGQPITLTVVRGGKEWITLTGIAGAADVQLRPGTQTQGKLGFGPQPGQGPRVSLVRSVEQGLNSFRNFFLLFYMMFQRGEVTKSVGGPVSILGILGQVAKLPPFYYAGVLGQLSLSLAVFNLVPIPVLDGGHMLLLSFEVLRRRRLEPEMQKVAAMCGLAIIGVLFVLIFFKDLRGLFG